MPVIQTSIFTVIERFPDHKDSIKLLYRESKTFQTICDDYRQCAEALKRWNQLSSEEAHAREKEYAELLQDLEAEILHNLEESE